MLRIYWKVIAAGLLGLFGLLGALSMEYGAPMRSGPLEKLRELRHSSHASPIAGRLSGEPPILAAPADAKTLGDFRRALASSRAAAMAAEAKEAESLYLLIGGRVDEAIRLHDPSNPEAINNLAVSYLTRGLRLDASLDLLKALELLDQAYREGSRRPEILFNRALVLQSLHLRNLAVAAFREFLAREKQGRWADSARLAIFELTREAGRQEWSLLADRLNADPTEEDLLAAAGKFPTEARRLCEGRLLRQAVEEAAGGRSAAAAPWLERARRLGAILAEKRQDRLLLEAAEQFQTIFAGGTPYEIARASAALQLYFAGADHSAKQEHKAAAPLLLEAARQLEAFGSPLAYQAELAAEIARYNANAARSASRLAALRQRIPARYPELAGRCLWMLGIARAAEGKFEASAAAYAEARELTAGTSGIARAANLDLLLAENLDGRGEVARAWGHRRSAMSVLAYQIDSRRRYGALIEAAQALGRNRRAQLALVFLAEASKVIDSSYDEPYARIEVELEVAANLLRLERPLEASACLVRARARIAGLAPSDFRQGLETQARFLRGQMILAHDPYGAYREFQAVEAAIRRAELKFRELPALLALAEAEQHAAAPGTYRQTLARAVVSLEQTRREIRGVAESSESFRRAEEIFERLILAALDRETGAAEAFFWTERSRAQHLLDRWRGEAGGETRLATLQEVAVQLPREDVLLEYVFAREELYCWIVDRGEARLVKLDVSRSRLAEQVEFFLESLEDGAPERHLRETGEVLHRELVAPLGLDLRPGSHLVVVADEPIRLIPFAALVEPGSGAYLIEKAIVSVAPSATLYLLARQRSEERTAEPKPLVVGIRKLESGPYAGLDELEGAIAEAESIAQILPGAVLLLDRQATRRQLGTRLQEANVLHFSGHGLASTQQSAGSAMVLAPESPADDGLLRLADLEAMPTGKLRLATLSACETLRGYETGREGSLSLAQAFFAAGVPAVIGTRWKIGDRASVVLMQDFYRALESRPPAEALHHAQLAALRSGFPVSASPASWAAFELIGW